MSIYFVKGKGWRYDFTQKGIRHTEAWFETKKEASQAEAKKKEEVKSPLLEQKIQTDMDFLTLVNYRLDHVKAYNSKRHYDEYIYIARRWTKIWGKFQCTQINQQMVEKFILERKKVSNFTANKEIRYLKATFNFGIKKKLIIYNPVNGIDFLPIEKKLKYVPSSDDIDKVITLADPDTRDYLWTIRETMGRMSEINRLTWEDVNFEQQYVVLYTRKKKGGHLTPRRVPMTKKLYEVLMSRYQKRDQAKPWVFWHKFISSKDKEMKIGPFQERKKFMKTLCKKAGVRYFRFHALRHSGASIMENSNVSIGTIQRILGHENRSTTEIYLHTLGDGDRVAIEAYENARQKKSHTDSHIKK